MFRHRFSSRRPITVRTPRNENGAYDIHQGAGMFSVCLAGDGFISPSTLLIIQVNMDSEAKDKSSEGLLLCRGPVAIGMCEAFIY